MPVIIQNGGGDDITGSEAIAYGAGVLGSYATRPTTIWDPAITGASPTSGSGDYSPATTQVVSNVETKLDAVASGWVDSGGPGGHQLAVAHEILRRAALLQGDLALSVRQWAKPGRDRALMEMFAVLTKALVDRDRLLLELRERMNASPY